MPFSRLNYRHLYYFWKVAKEGHLTRVAEQLHVSQSALSAQIRQLEDQIQQKLFEREGRSLRLTEVGQFVLDYAENIFSLGNELTQALADGARQSVQLLRVGAMATLSRNFQENFLRPIYQMEQVRLRLESGTLEALMERLELHKLDLILANRPVSSTRDKTWLCRRIARQPVCLVGPPRKRSRPFVFPQDLATVRLLLPGPDSDIRMEFDMVCQHHHITPDVYAEVDDMALLRLMARDSGGVALVPAVVVQDELQSGTLQQYCVVPRVYENFYAISVRRQLQSDVLKMLIGARA